MHKASNGWALAPAKSVSGNAILVANPQLGWGVNQPLPGLGVYQWMEANLVVGDPDNPLVNAYGVAFPGSPCLGIGFNDYLGWTHTNNAIKNADLYELQLSGDGYPLMATFTRSTCEPRRSKYANPTAPSSPKPSRCFHRSMDPSLPSAMIKRLRCASPALTPVRS